MQWGVGGGRLYEAFVRHLYCMFASFGGIQHNNSTLHAKVRYRRIRFNVIIPYLPNKTFSDVFVHYTNFIYSLFFERF